jgi:hypothetical protein
LVVLGVLGEVLGVLELPDDEEPEPIEPELEPVLPAPLLDPEPMLLPDPVVLPEPLLPPYCFTQSSRSVPVLPAHWLGSAALSLLELPLAPAPVEPLAPEPVVAAGLLLEPPRPPLLLPEELPELCAHDVLARPSNAAATAAVSVFAITMFSP